MASLRRCSDGFTLQLFAVESLWALQSMRIAGVFRWRYCQWFFSGSHRLFSRLQDCSSGMWPRSAGGPVPTGRNKSKTKCKAFVLAGICWHCFKTLQALVYFVVTYFRCTILQSGADFSSISGRAQRRRPETSEKTSHGEWLCLMILHKSVVNLPMWSPFVPTWTVGCLSFREEMFPGNSGLCRQELQSQSHQLARGWRVYGPVLTMRALQLRGICFQFRSCWTCGA